MANTNELTLNINKIHTTKLGIGRIKQNLGLETDEVVEWCKQKIMQADEIMKKGKNWYVYSADSVMTINANSFTIITAHKIAVKEITASGFSLAEMEDAYNFILSMIQKAEKTQEKPTAARRLKALRTAASLITAEMKK